MGCLCRIRPLLRVVEFDVGSLKVFVEPIQDVLQALDPVRWLAAARQLVPFARESNQSCPVTEAYTAAAASMAAFRFLCSAAQQGLAGAPRLHRGLLQKHRTFLQHFVWLSASVLQLLTPA